MRASLLPAKKKPIIRRAIFAFIHPHDGPSVIRREVFRRHKFVSSLLRPLDECWQKENLVDTANRAIRQLLPSHPFHLRRGYMFPTSGGLSEHKVESTVFRVDTPLPEVFLSWATESYKKLETHHLQNLIEPALEAIEHPVKKRALG